MHASKCNKTLFSSDLVTWRTSQSRNTASHNVQGQLHRPSVLVRFESNGNEVRPAEDELLSLRLNSIGLSDCHLVGNSCEKEMSQYICIGKIGANIFSNNSRQSARNRIPDDPHVSNKRLHETSFGYLSNKELSRHTFADRGPKIFRVSFHERTWTSLTFSRLRAQT